MMRDHLGHRYTPNPVTMVDEQGCMMLQNPASVSAIGVHGWVAGTGNLRASRGCAWHMK